MRGVETYARHITMIDDKFKYMQKTSTELSSLGLVLRSQIYGDKDLILSILTIASGKIGVIVKSAKSGKKFSAGIPEILDLGQFELRKGRGPLFYVQNFRPQQAFKRIRSSMNSFVCACCWIEVLEHLTAEAHQDSHELFEIALAVLERLDQSSDARSACRILCEGLDTALGITGFGSEHAILPTGFKKMQALIARITEVSGRELKSWDSVVEIINNMKNVG